MSAAQIYNFEAVFEPAFAGLFLAQNIIAYTSQGRLNDDGTLDPKPDFQKDRPRVEVVFTKGPGRRQWHLPDAPQPNIPAVMQSRESGWIGRLSVAVVTDADTDQHFSFLPAVRNIMANIPAAMDGLAITTHCINGPIQDQGETHGYNKEDGYYLTTLNYAFDFSIQRDAWALLNQP
jgi:hypothetical protein